MWYAYLWYNARLMGSHSSLRRMGPGAAGAAVGLINCTII